MLNMRSIHTLVCQVNKVTNEQCLTAAYPQMIFAPTKNACLPEKKYPLILLWNILKIRLSGSDSW